MARRTSTSVAGRSCISFMMEPIDDIRSWYDIIVEEDHHRRTRLLCMTAAEWEEERRRILRAWRGRDITPCKEFLEGVDRQRKALAERAQRLAKRAAKAAAAGPQAVVVVPQQGLDFALWRDIVEEPWKYGDEGLRRWLQLDDALKAGPGRWRLEAYWLAKEAELAESERLARPGKAVTRIAAAVRGHLARRKLPYLDCCMCLSHRICAFQTAVGRMCRGCREQGPYEDETGPVEDGWNWFRSDCKDLSKAVAV